MSDPTFYPAAEFGCFYAYSDGAYLYAPMLADGTADLANTAEVAPEFKAQAAKYAGVVATPDQLRWMEDSLANDEASTDAELVQHFTDAYGVNEATARAAVAHRDYFLSTPIPEAGVLADLLEASNA